jgi:hypothetical protein
VGALGEGSDRRTYPGQRTRATTMNSEKLGEHRIVTVSITGDPTTYYAEAYCDARELRGQVQPCTGIKYSVGRRSVNISYSVPGPKGKHCFKMQIPRLQAVVTERFFPVVEVSDDTEGAVGDLAYRLYDHLFHKLSHTERGNLDLSESDWEWLIEYEETRQL